MTITEKQCGYIRFLVHKKLRSLYAGKIHQEGFIDFLVATILMGGGYLDYTRITSEQASIVIDKIQSGEAKELYKERHSN